MTPSIRVLILFVLIVFAVGASGSIVSGGAWYDALSKPSWTPPGYLFGPVWSVLYLMIAISGWLVWRQTGFVSAAMGVFAIQLLLNAAWSWIFFGAHRVGWGLIDIAALWVAIVATIGAFARVSPLAAGLLVPYLLWVSFATALNFSIWRLNG